MKAVGNYCVTSVGIPTTLVLAVVRSLRTCHSSSDNLISDMLWLQVVLFGSILMPGLQALRITATRGAAQIPGRLQSNDRSMHQVQTSSPRSPLCRRARCPMMQSEHNSPFSFLLKGLTSALEGALDMARPGLNGLIETAEEALLASDEAVELLGDNLAIG